MIMERRNIKEEKEAFVTGHAGTTIWEIMLVSLSGPFGIVVCQYLYSILSCKQQQQQQSESTSSNFVMVFLLLIFIEAITIFIPMIIVQSNYLYPYGCMIVIIQALLIFYFRYYLSSSSSLRKTTTLEEKEKEASSDDSNQQQQRRQSKLSSKLSSKSSSSIKLNYITAYRSLLLVMTFIAILAVDFHIFPRRFVKTEIYGYGLMDLGAASFAFSAGLVSNKSRTNKRKRKQSRQQGQQQSNNSNQNNKFLIHVLPLILIGIIRIITNKELDYQEHVSEYGVHWNFFFTLGVLAIIPRFFDSKKNPSWIVPTFIMTIYQFSLSVMGIQQFIETAPRSCEQHIVFSENENSFPSLFLNTIVRPIICNIVFANREGILGCFGYLSLYFTGEWIGYTYLWNNNVNDDDTSSSSSKLEESTSTSSWSWSLEKLCLCTWIVLGITTTILQIPVSRRSTNISFCLWSISHNLSLLIVLKHFILQKQQTTTTKEEEDHYHFPIIMERINRHGLILFLIANLLTGLVNLTIPTLDVSDGWAFVILLGYISTIGIVALILEDVITPLVLLRSSISKSKSRTNENKNTTTTTTTKGTKSD